MEVIEKVRRIEAEIKLVLESSLQPYLVRELISICYTYVIDTDLLFEEKLLWHCWNKKDPGIGMNDVFDNISKSGDVLWTNYLANLTRYVGKHYPKKPAASKFSHAVSVYQRLREQFVPCHRLQCFYGFDEFPTDDNGCVCGHPVQPTKEIMDHYLLLTL